MSTIKFGTDGWRAIIAKDYTIDNLRRVTEATAKWLTQKGLDKVVIGHDCRFGGQMFAETTTGIFGAFGIKVHLAKGYVTTPMVSLGVAKTKASLGIVITASHNPPDYNGYKIKSSFGGPALPNQIAEVEALIPDAPSVEPMVLDIMFEEGLLNYIDLESIYISHAEANFNLQAIRDANIKVAYDAMYGAGQRVFKQLLPNAVLLHCEENPSFMGQAPEPIHRNLGQLSALVGSDDSIACGIANDGDADRIGMYDEDGNFVDSHHILLLLLLYTYQYKNLQGKVVVTFSVTDKMRRLAELFSLDFEVTKIGFKYIAEIMQNEDVLVGGEESGGLAVKGHIPERDGIWIALLLLEFMAQTGKSLKQLIGDIYELVGPFAFNRDDLHLADSQKQAIIAKCRENAYTQFGAYQVQRTESLDGFKFFFNDNEWVMIRPSGTEPLLRVYAQAPTNEAVRNILDATKAAILEGEAAMSS